MVSPLASDCSTGLLSASVKLQPTVAVLPVSVVISLTPEGPDVSARVPIWLTLLVKPGRTGLEADDANVALRTPLTTENTIVPAVDRVTFNATESSVNGEPLIAVARRKNNISAAVSVMEAVEVVPLPIPGTVKSKAVSPAALDGC